MKKKQLKLELELLKERNLFLEKELREVLFFIYQFKNVYIETEISECLESGCIKTLTYLKTHNCDDAKYKINYSFIVHVIEGYTLINKIGE